MPRLASLVLPVVGGLCACLAAACFSSSSSGNPLAPTFDAGFDTGFLEPDGSVDSGSPDVTVPVESAAPEAASPEAGSPEAAVEAAAEASVESGVDASAEAAVDASTPVEAGLVGQVATGTGLAWPEGLVVVGQTLFWIDSSDPASNQGTMQSCDLSSGSCAPQLLSGLTYLPPNTQLATDGMSLFMPLGGVSIYSMEHIETCPAATCSSTTISGSNDGVGNIGAWDEITGIAADSQNIYYAAGIPSSTYGVWIASKTNAFAQYALASGLPHTANIAVDANNVYFGESAGGIYECSLAPDAGACTPMLLQATTATSGVAVDATHLYWGDPVAGAVYQCPLAGCGASNPTTIVTNQGHVNSLAVDGTLIFYSVGTSVDAGAPIGVFGALL
jgi:hypothetical protein